MLLGVIYNYEYLTSDERVIRRGLVNALLFRLIRLIG